METINLGELGWDANSCNDTLLGGDGNDVLLGDGGNDVLNGGASTDLAAFIGHIEDFNFKLKGSDLLLRHNMTGEVDTLRQVELLQIGDTTYHLDVSTLPTGDYAALEGHVQLATEQEMAIIGLPAF